jgi:hypothetical protein
MADLQAARNNTGIDASSHLTTVVFRPPAPLPAIASEIPAVKPEPPPDRYLYSSSLQLPSVEEQS